MIVRMRGSAFLAAFGLPLAGCSVLLDWSDYSGGSSDASNVDMSKVADGPSQTIMDAAIAVDVTATTTTDAHDAQSPEDVVAAVETGQPEAAGPTCDLPACPTQVCTITVYFRACCLPDGGCGCESPTGPCM
jgi:hypothetical protein